MSSRDTYVEINLNNFRDNFIYMQKKAGAPLVAVLKANAYGHGTMEIAKEAEKLGVEAIAVAFFEDASKIREAGINSRIIIFNYCRADNLKDMIDKNFTVTINSIEQIQEYIQYDLKNAKKLDFGVNINTGMNRQGISQEEVSCLHDIIQENNLKITDLFSHFSNAGSDKNFTKKQYEKFEDIVKKFENFGYKKLKKSMSNSAAVLVSKEYSFDYVRVGMALFGLQPQPITPDKNLKPVLSLSSVVSRIRDVKKGEIVGYSGSFIADKDLKICIIPVGYADGILFSLGNKGKALINGEKYKIISEICMDQTIISIENNKEIKIGDKVILIGSQSKEIITAEEIAEDAGTIADDIISKLSPNLKRIYRKG